MGVDGTGIVCHGRSNAKAIKNAIKVAAEMIRSKVNDHIIQLLSESSHGYAQEVQSAAAPPTEPGAGA